MTPPRGPVPVGRTLGSRTPAGGPRRTVEQVRGVRRAQGKSDAPADQGRVNFTVTIERRVSVTTFPAGSALSSCHRSPFSPCLERKETFGAPANRLSEGWSVTFFSPP